MGGAIGSDIHGKAHHVEGSFGDHVLSFDLLTADGEIATLTPADELFWATVGGMGLTGIVLKATLHLNHVETAYFLVDTEQLGGLEELMARQSVDDEKYVESVSWFDAVTTGHEDGVITVDLAEVDHAHRERRPGRVRTRFQRGLTLPAGTMPDRLRTHLPKEGDLSGSDPGR